MSETAIKLFISYAHEDENYRDRLLVHLRPHTRKGIVKVWQDQDILPGQEWDKYIKKELYEADITLFLISPDFLNSNYVDSVEVKEAMQLHDKGKVILVPIVVRTSNLGMTELSRFQALPKHAKAISTWSDRDAAWTDVVKGLERLFKHIKQKHSNNSGSSNSSSDSPTVEAPTKADNPKINQLEEIQGWIGQAKMGKAIDELLVLVQNEYPDYRNQMIMQSARWRQLQTNQSMGMISFQEANMTQAQITNAVLSIINDLRRENG